MTPNPSIEGTAQSLLRSPGLSDHIERRVESASLIDAVSCNFSAKFGSAADRLELLSEPRSEHDE